MTTTFLLRGAGFSATEVATINKVWASLPPLQAPCSVETIMIKLGLFRSLLMFGVLQMISNLSFMVLAWWKELRNHDLRVPLKILWRHGYRSICGIPHGNLQ